MLEKCQKFRFWDLKGGKKGEKKGEKEKANLPKVMKREIRENSEKQLKNSGYRQLIFAKIEEF